LPFGRDYFINRQVKFDHVKKIGAVTYRIFCAIVIAPRLFDGILSAEGFGLTVSLYSYSNLSFSEDLADICAEQFHLLREFMFEHHESKLILLAID
jgi:hypothetical protein